MVFVMMIKTRCSVRVGDAATNDSHPQALGALASSAALCSILGSIINFA